MRVEYTHLLGYRYRIKEVILKNSTLDPEFFIFLELIIKIQMALFFCTVIAIMYTIFKYSRFGVKIRSLYSLDLVYDEKMFPVRQGVAMLLLYYYLVAYSILYPRLFVVGAYRPTEATVKELIAWSINSLKYIYNTYISIW